MKMDGRVKPGNDAERNITRMGSGNRQTGYLICPVKPWIKSGGGQRHRQDQPNEKCSRSGFGVSKSAALANPRVVSAKAVIHYLVL
jgi:hypothetical protein